MKLTTFCQGCWESGRKVIALRGPLAVFYRPFGIRQSKMHPNMCTLCEDNFAKIQKQKQIQIPATILFADIRGYTGLSETLEPEKVNDLLHYFYDQCAEAVWDEDGIVNKFIGDAVLAIFNFPLIRPDHVRHAVLAAISLQHKCANLKSEFNLTGHGQVGIGIGIHTGTTSMGEVGTNYKDFTAVGPVVNLTSRLQSTAGVGEIVMTEEVYAAVKSDFPDAEKKTFTLKGISEPVSAYVLQVKA